MSRFVHSGFSNDVVHQNVTETQFSHLSLGIVSSIDLLLGPWWYQRVGISINVLRMLN